MTYYCSDCSYRGKKSGALGECPACGSYNLVKRQAGDDHKTAKPARWRLVVVTLLWGYLLALVAWKMIR